MATLRYLPNRKKWLVRWQITIKFGDKKGDQYKGSKTFQNKRNAEEFLIVIRRQEDRIAVGDIPSDHSIKNATDQWTGHLKQYTPATRDLYADYLDKFIATLPAYCKRLSQITPKIIGDYLDTMAADVSARTVNSHLDVIRSFFKWASKKYHLSENPTRGIKHRLEDPPSPRFLTESEYKKICEHAQGDTLDWILFIANTGLRVSEFISLTWTAVNTDQSAITFLGKGRRYRTIPLNATCQDILKRQQEHQNTSTYIFLSKNNEPLKRRNLNTRFRPIAKKAGIDAFGPHALRHYFATQLLIKGLSIQLVSKLLGHRSIKTTENTYIHILPDHLVGTTDILIDGKL